LARSVGWKRQYLALAGWEYDIEPVKSSASFKNNKLEKTYVPYVPSCFN
jgi:hypothetical protein